MPGHLAGGLGFRDDELKVAPFRVAKQVLKVAREPVFDAMIGLLGVAFERFCHGLDDFGFHR